MTKSAPNSVQERRLAGTRVAVPMACAQRAFRRDRPAGLCLYSSLSSLLDRNRRNDIESVKGDVGATIDFGLAASSQVRCPVANTLLQIVLARIGLASTTDC